MSISLRKKIKNYSTSDLKEIIEYYSNNINDLQIDSMFVIKPTKKEDFYKTYMFQCSNKSIEPAIIGTLNNIIYYCNKRTIDKYDLEISIDDTIQVIEKEKVLRSDDILSNITINYFKENTLNDSVDFEKLNFLVIQLSTSKIDMPNITIFKKHSKSSSNYKNSVSGTFIGNEYKPINKKILTINDAVDAIIIDDYYYIFNRNNFNSMLNFKDVYYKIIEDNKVDIISSNLFDDTEEFIETCTKDGRYLQRFTKAILADGFKNVKKNKKNLPSIIKKHKLNISLNEDGEIVYDKINTHEILNLLLQHYVTSDLTQKSMIAKAIEQYEI